MRIPLLLFCVLLSFAFLAAAEIPDGLSASAAKSIKNYQRDVARSLENLSKKIDKSRIKIVGPQVLKY